MPPLGDRVEPGQQVVAGRAGDRGAVFEGGAGGGEGVGQTRQRGRGVEVVAEAYSLVPERLGGARGQQPRHERGGIRAVLADGGGLLDRRRGRWCR